ncbi:DUF6994 family protein [Arthrobacter sp. ISL-85]|uniref:DUF6994 family protein n=1 Tax=Arthrobacter sp. ISL-85 TaxID=2819115 RepID=UPI0037BF5EC5
MTAGVDTSFNYHDDSDGKDPDKYSPTLRRHHQILWSRELPKRRGTLCLAPKAGSRLDYRSPLGVSISPVMPLPPGCCTGPPVSYAPFPRQKFLPTAATRREAPWCSLATSLTER